MPTFDFQCNDCGHVFEFKRSFTSKKIPSCPACNSRETEKLIAPPVIHFRGTGFFVTDHGGKTGKSTEKKVEKDEKKESKAEQAAHTKEENTPQKNEEKPKSK